MQATAYASERALLAQRDAPADGSFFEWLHARPAAAALAGSFAVVMLIVVTPILTLFELVHSGFGASTTHTTHARGAVCPMWKFSGF